MTISQLRQKAKNLKDLADRVVLYGEKESLEDAWRRLEELFRQAGEVLDKKADGFILNDVSPSWDEVSKRANHVTLACDVAEPPASGDVPGDYGT